MNKMTLFCLALILASPLVADAQQGKQNVGELDPSEEATLVFLREEEKLARDAYISMNQLWSKPSFENIAESEQKHMDALLKKLLLFEIDDPVTSDEIGAFSNPQLASLYDSLVETGSDSLLDAFGMGAYIEEMSISELQIAMGETDEKPLINAYGNLLTASRNHLRIWVGHIEAMGIEYSAQFLEQQTVDEIVGDLVLPPTEGFDIGRGLNDAWFNPDTSGQGFFITAYPEIELMFLGWLTFDTERPAEDVTAGLGGPGHRWLTAQGNFTGSLAELTIINTTGGVFDSASPEATGETYGSLLIQFDSCRSGTVIYDIPSLELKGLIPIQRITPECPGQRENP